MIGWKVRNSSVWVVPIVVGFLFVPAFARADLQISGYQERLHDPYYVGADKAFIGAAYNWSGVGRIEDPVGTSSNWKTLTMISDNFFITANHFQPNRGDDPAGTAPKVRFYRTTDPNGEFWESEIAVSGTQYQGQRVGLTDLWVGKLANTPPSWVMRYPLAKRHEATNYLSYTNHDLFIFGQDSPRSFTSLRVGRNEIDQVDIGGNYSWSYDPANGLGADETETQGGDSGAPSFFTDGRIPVLAGIHTRTNFDTGVSKNLQQIIDTIGEPISISTGLVGDLNGNFQVNAADFFAMTIGVSSNGSARHYQGDLTGDGFVDIRDFQLFSTNFGKSMFAPADSNRDGDVDGYDLARIGASWGKSVAPFTLGDTNGDGVVGFADLEIFDRDQFRAFFGPLPAPLAPIAGDLTGNGVVDGFDLSEVTANLNTMVTPGTSGDADGNGVVDQLDVAFVSTRIGNSFGDLNGDHEVGPADFVILAKNWNQFLGGGRLNGDMNGDKLVNSTDARILFDWWGQQGGEFPNMLVPEPATLSLAALSMMVVLSIMHRQRRSNSTRNLWTFEIKVRYNSPLEGRTIAARVERRLQKFWKRRVAYMFTRILFAWIAAASIAAEARAADVIFELRLNPAMPGCVDCTLSGPGTYNLLARTSDGDNFGISRYSIPVLNVASLLHRSPRATINPNGDEAQPAGFSLLRTTNNNMAIPGGFLMIAVQDVVTPSLYLVSGFGQEASSFAAEFPGQQIGGALAQPSWNANLLLAEGTYIAGNIPLIDLNNIDAFAGVFADMAGSTTLRANLLVVPEPASTSVCGTTLVGLLLALRRSIVRRHLTSPAPS